MLEWLKNEFDIIVAKVEAEAKSAWGLLISFIKEAIKEEEAALWPQVKAQAVQLFNDEVKMSGLVTVQERVALIVQEILADLVVDGIIAKHTLVNAYVWAVAHQTGQIDGNQGNLVGGNTTGS